MGDFFAPDARLMWPSLEDIVGREHIRSAYERLAETYTTIAWQPERTVIGPSGRKVVTIGRFIEDRAPRSGGAAERIHGRLVEVWARKPDGGWELEVLLTSRYADSEQLG